MLPARVLFISLGAIAVLFTSNLIQSWVFNPSVTQSLKRRSDPNSTLTCGFIGNSDVYGLGIRVGVYLQWSASIISKRYFGRSSPDVLRELLDANSIFSLSIFVATALFANRNVGPVYGVEILILLHIFFASAYIVSYDQLLKGPHLVGLTFWGLSVTLTITTGMSAFAVWFWFTGLDNLPGTNCGSFAFLFAKVDLIGPARIFFKIAAIFNLVLWATGFIILLIIIHIPILVFMIGMPFWGLFALAKKLTDKRKGQDPSQFAKWRTESTSHARYFLTFVIGILGSRDEENKGFWTPKKKSPSRPWFDGLMKIMSSDGKPNRVVVSWPITSTCILIYSILAIELIIRWNDISGVYTINSTGQVIPFVIGIGGLWRSIFAITVRSLNNSKWSPNNESFRLKDNKTWVKFPISKPERRNSWTGQPSVKWE